jgi:hypothetical protein
MSVHEYEKLSGNYLKYDQRTAPLTAKSSPRLIVVPTAMKFLCPDSVLKVSRGTHASELMNSFAANSYLKVYEHDD